MPSRNYLQHGSRHRPEGTDPMPGSYPAWAILSGTQVVTGGSPSATLAAGANGICIFTHFDVGGDFEIFATHDSSTRPSYPVPPPSGFHNTSGDTVVWAVKTGILWWTFDINFNGAGTFPIQVGRNPGGSSYQGGEVAGPQAWYSSVAGSTTNRFSWSTIRPIDNDPSDAADTGGQGLYYSFELQITNNDSVGHTIDSGTGFQLQIGWAPVLPSTLKHWY